MSALLQDVRYALRMLRRSPGFTAAVVAILALGIGFNAAVFSLIDAGVLSPLPGASRPAELVELANGEYPAFSYPSYVGFRSSGSVFSGLAAGGNRSLGLSGKGAPELIRGTVVSANYFDVLGVRPSLGRFFVPAEEESGQNLAVLSERMWQRHLGGSRSAAGSVVLLNGVPFTVIGVALRGFRGAGFGHPPDLWIPMGAWQRGDRRPRAPRLPPPLGMAVGLRAPRSRRRLAQAARPSTRSRSARRATSRETFRRTGSISSLSRGPRRRRDPADPIRLFGLSSAP
jgi:hypothetical protein